MKIAQLIDALGGKLVHGNAHTEIRAVNAVDHAAAGDLVFAEDAATVAEALESAASALVLKAGLPQAGVLAPDPARACTTAIVEDNQPRLWFARAAQLLAPPLPVAGVHPSAVIGASVQLGPDVTIAACAVIGDGAEIGRATRIEAGAVIGAGVRIGEHCRIYPRVVVYPGATIGNRVMVHAGVVLGADGFGYVRDPATGAYTQFPQQGTLVIEDDVEIGANCTIDRGALAETRIRRGAKFDNLVHVGHNVHIGQDVVIAAQTGLSGSAVVEDNVIIGGQVGIADHVRIEAGAILGAQSGIPTKKVIRGKGVVFWGTPARPIREYLKELAFVSRSAKKQR